MTLAPDKITVSSWLADLRMECYKKHLEDFETIKQLLELKETEQRLKKLGVVNSKDRATMMGSLDSFKKDKPVHPSPTTNIQQQEKSKGSTKKSKLKSLLSSGNSRKSKKKSDNFSTPVPATSLQITEIASPPDSPPHRDNKGKSISSTVDDYEEMPELSPRSRAMTLDGKPFYNWKSVVENEYVPSPDSSPRFDEQRLRASTVSGLNHQPQPLRPSPHANGDIQYRNRVDMGRKDESSGILKHRHLSGASLESGLSFGYDVEKDFNPSIPLESQPWFRGRISRTEAESLLNEDGDFIVRENTAILNTYTLTLRWRGEYDHTMISTTEVVNSRGDIRRATGVKYHFESGAFDTIPELIFNHLKYQIPIDTAQHTLITNPICRPGTSNSSTPSSSHRSYITQHSYAHPPFTHTDIAPSPSTLPRNFGRKGSLPEEAATRVTSHTMARGGIPPHTRHHGNTSTLKQSSSSDDLLDDKPRYNERNYRSVISPPPLSNYQPHSATVNSGPRHTQLVAPETQQGPAHGRQESFGDYVAMGSVSICGDTDSLVDPQERQRTHTMPTTGTQSQSSVKSSDRVNYAEIMCLRSQDKTPMTMVIAETTPGQRNVQYAEVRFIPKQPTSARNTSPYQSRASLLAGRASVESSPSTSVGYARIKFDDSSPHPFSQYATIQKSNSSSLSSSRECSPRPRSQTEAQAHTEHRRKMMDRASTASNDSALSTNSSHSSGSVTPQSSLLVHSHAPSAKVHRDLPGYDTLVKVHTILQSHSNKQLAYHLTRADAVSFLLAPRPGEEESVWRERINKMISSSGMYRGLQTLADPDGEKLWKKLYFRHLNLAQTITLCIITAGDALERAKLLHRFIEIASLLQSGKFGNLFSFIAILQGINVPQITDMADVWDLLSRHFPTSASLHKNLLSVISNLNEGVAMFSTEQLTIPAIQHLKTVFHFIEPSLPGHLTSCEDKSLVGEYWSLACGLDGIRNIVSHTSQFSYNARCKLEGRKYDAGLMDFFLSDFTRVYLQSIGVHVDDPMERRRRFAVLMDALVLRVEASETV